MDELNYYLSLLYQQRMARRIFGDDTYLQAEMDQAYREIPADCLANLRASLETAVEVAG